MLWRYAIYPSRPAYLHTIFSAAFTDLWHRYSSCEQSKSTNGCFPDVQEARLAIEQVVIPKGESAQLLPRPSSIISSQVGLVESFSLKWEVVGQEPKACVRILPHFAPKQVEAVARETPAEPADSDWESHDDSDHTQSGITRLPFLPD